MSKPSLVVFAHVPPPEHGQSMMIAEMLHALESKDAAMQVNHVDSRYSDGMDDIGSVNGGKALPMLRYLWEAAKYRFRGTRVLYYVAGPAKRSSIVRDSITLLLLRRLYPKIIFHWHAIGYGTWATGTDRSELFGSELANSFFRKISKFGLLKPDLSICLTSTTQSDARAVESKEIVVVSNGIADPCSQEISQILDQREKRHQQITQEGKEIRVLFLSYGTVEKGLLDSLKCISLWLSQDRASRSIHLTLAGGISDSIADEVSMVISETTQKFGKRFRVEIKEFVKGREKDDCFRESDIFLAASHWESFGLVAVESMAWGLPTIAVLSDGLKGVIPEDYPYTAKVMDPEGMVDALNSCLSDFSSEKGRRICEQLRRTYEERFTLEQYQTEISTTLLEFTSASQESSP